MRLRIVALVLTLALGILTPFAAEAQQAGTVYRIGLLGVGTASGYAREVEALQAGLRDLGYVEGKNILIEHRWAEGKYERLPDLARDLVRLKVDLIVTHGTPGIRAAQQATTTIPIVMATSGDAVAAGLVASLARPGGNTTGSSFFVPELNAKRVELLKEAIPSIRRVAALMNSANPVSEVAFKQMQLTAQALGIEVRPAWVRGGDELDGTFSALVNARTDGLAIVDDPALYAQARRLADLAAKHRLPMAAPLFFVQTGGLLSYGVNIADLWRRAATFVDKILKGAKPADLPVEQPTKFELVINLKTAKALGLTIPQSVLFRADEVIR